MGSLRIVLASEMGGGWGHLLPLRIIAREFIRQGAEVVLLARDAVKAKKAFSGLNGAIHPLPAWTMRKTGFSVNYAHCLWGNGYWQRERFEEHLHWWIERLQTLGASFVLSDFSPTALLAARVRGLPRGAIGTGFTLPPPVSPLPSLHPWLNLTQKELAVAEAPVLATVQSVLPDVHALSDLFAGAMRFLTIFPELDHFACRPCEKFWGPILDQASEDGFNWPEAAGPKIFLYLNSLNRCLNHLLDHLRRLAVPVVGYIGGITESERQALASPTLKLSCSLVSLEQAAREADYAVTQGGLHTTAAMLLAGVPTLICPEQFEQVLFAFRLNQQGLCEWLSPWTDSGQVGKRFDRLVSSANPVKNVAAFSEKYSGYDPAATVSAVVRACLEAVA